MDAVEDHSQVVTVEEHNPGDTAVSRVDNLSRDIALVAVPEVAAGELEEEVDHHLPGAVHPAEEAASTLVLEAATMEGLVVVA